MRFSPDRNLNCTIVPAHSFNYKWETPQDGSTSLGMTAPQTHPVVLTNSWGRILTVNQKDAATMTAMHKPKTWRKSWYKTWYKTWRVSDWFMAFGLMVVTAPIAFAQQSPKNFIIGDTPRPVAAVRFDDGRGQERSLSDFRGKVVLLNIWATWCVPCRKEMPELDHLEALLGGLKFTVVTVSVDRLGIEAVGKFFEEVGVQKLPAYVDNSGNALRTLRAFGLPTSLVIDRDGRELGRITGPAEWDSPQTIEFLRNLISQQPCSGDCPFDRGDITAPAKPESYPFVHPAIAGFG
jgi:thiol-disulfide isomerase/thioredoxin